MGKKGKIGKQRKDRFYHLAKETGYRSRAAFKLIQLNRKFEFLQKSKVLIDLCAAPGGWLQVAQKYMPVQSIIVGVDLAPIKPIHNVITLQEDITTQKCRSLLSKELKTWKVDVVLNDGAPNVGKSWLHDAFEQNRLTLSALHLACDFLIKGGWFVTKVFRSKDYNSLMWVFKKLFQRVHATKPRASRNESAEIFVVCQHFIAPDKIDAKFFDPTYVFAEIAEKEQHMSKADLLKPPSNKKPKAEGYQDGTILLHQKVKCSDFIQTPNYIDLLGKANEIVIDSDDIRNHPSTSDEVIECIKDLKVLGRKELTLLMAWRKKIRDDLLKNGIDTIAAEDDDDDIGAIEEQSGGDVVDDNEEEEEEDVEDAEQREEAQKLKRKKRKIAKEKKKIEERLNLKMILKDDQLVQEEQDLFNLKNLRKASQMNKLNENVEPNDDDDDDDYETEPKLKKKRMLYDKDSEQKYFDPDDSDANEDDDDDDPDDLDENNANKMDITADDSNDDEDDDDDQDRNEILVDLEDKHDKMRDMTKMFFDNKLFNQLNNANDDDDDDGDGDDLDYNDDIELEELERQISNVKRDRKTKNGTAETEAKSDAKVVSKKAKKSAENSEMSNSLNGDHVSDDDGTDDDEDDDNDNDDRTNRSVRSSEKLSPEEMALGALMIKSRKTRRDLLDDGWNRYVHEDDDHLPSWFRKEEQTYMRKAVPVTGEMTREYENRLREINSRPIKKAMEAKARKKKRALRRLEKARHKAESVTDEADMSNKEKAQYIRSIYKKALHKDKDKVQLVVGKKQYGNRRPPGVKGRYKVVDSRLKKDKRKQQQRERKGGGKRQTKKGAKGKTAAARGRGRK